MKKVPCLYIVIPCYNEEEVLPITSKQFTGKIQQLIKDKMISSNSRVLFVNDGSTDNTWNIIQGLAEENEYALGISLSKNRGHQNALLAGLFEAESLCDITISIDCDGQDDINAMDEMVKEYHKGNDIVYGVRNDRKTDSFFKRNSAQFYYKMLSLMGVEVVYNHADYRLMSSDVIRELKKYKETNLYLRGIIPTLGYNTTTVYYKREARLAGESHYPLSKMIPLALDGVTSFSIKPLRVIISFGMIVAFLSFIGVIWTLIASFMGNTVDGWASMTCIICFIGGIQLISIGILGIYIGKIYMEVKQRPKFNIISRTYEKPENSHSLSHIY